MEDQLFVELDKVIERNESGTLSELCTRNPEAAPVISIFRYLRTIDSVNSLEALDLEATNGRAELIAARARSEWSLPPASLIQTAERHGLSAESLASKLRLGVAYVVKLERRLFNPSNLPQALIDSLASSLFLSRQAVSEYLRLPPIAATGAAHRSRAGIRTSKQASFAITVINDESLKSEDRDYWRAILS